MDKIDVQCGFVIELFLVYTLCFFFLQAESSIALKPFLKDVSRSGLNSVMTGGFATIACTYIAAYIEFGVYITSI